MQLESQKLSEDADTTRSEIAQKQDDQQEMNTTTAYRAAQCNEVL